MPPARIQNARTEQTKITVKSLLCLNFFVCVLWHRIVCYDLRHNTALKGNDCLESSSSLLSLANLNTEMDLLISVILFVLRNVLKNVSMIPF